MRLAHLLAVACIVGATPAHAAIDGTRPTIDEPAFAFAAKRMSDVELAGVAGTGGGSGFRFLRDTTNTNARLVEQQTGLMLVTAFDNWFTDIGTPLIFANIAGSR